MSERIHELLHRNLQEVFGEGDPARRRAAIQELYTDSQALHNAGRLAWGSGPRGGKPDYTGMDMIIVRDDKIAALYVFLDPQP
ncbi:MAG: hypothetical protein WAV38_40395 [Xanthobacteraceae bacterium]